MVNKQIHDLEKERKKVNKIIKSDLKHIWHPCSQMKDFVCTPPLVIYSAKGSYLYTNQGPIIDAISSWWCKTLGHGHPAVTSAIKQQLQKFEHVMTGNTTYASMAKLGEKLAHISQNQFSFFASDGASAIDIAMKLVLHACQRQGKKNKLQFIALTGAYHGDTLGALSLSDLELYSSPYKTMAMNTYFLHSIPYVTDKNDPLWVNSELQWPSILSQLERVKENTCAIIIEPIVQGAAGMRIYSAHFLQKLAQWATLNSIYLIADEIMTGLGRTGKWLACEHSNIKADLICLSKGLTAGMTPLSCVLISKDILLSFYDDYQKGTSFLHSHTYSGHALGVNAALATLKVIEKEGLLEQAEQCGNQMYKYMKAIASATENLTNVRTIGAIVAADLVGFPSTSRLGYQFYKEALKRGALLRPLGTTLYWLPPLNIDSSTIARLADITFESLKALPHRT